MHKPNQLNSLNKRQPCQGFSIIEVLVSLVIMGIGLVALNALQAKVTADNAFSRQRTEAVSFAQTQLEQLRHFASPAEFNTLQNAEDTQAGENTTFTRNLEVQPLGNGLMQVDTTITWPDRDNDYRESANSIVRLSSILSDAFPTQAFKPIQVIHCSITNTCNTDTDTNNKPPLPVDKPDEPRLNDHPYCPIDTITDTNTDTDTETNTNNNN